MDAAALIEKLKSISNNLDSGKSLIGEQNILEFQNSVSIFSDKIEDILQQGRVLRLGIVGEVKAGKSSFLNALLFNGDDILPKAPTPMTAALTRISYGNNPKAKIVFYSKADWNIIEKNSEQYDITLTNEYQKYCKALEERNANSRNRIADNDNSDRNNVNQHRPQTPFKPPTLEAFEKNFKNNMPVEYNSCKELTDMVRNSHLNINEYIDKTIEVEIKNGSSDGYKNELNQYVGASGKFTPIVKYTELQLNNDLLEGIEIIDTPGLNDPILSRGRTTQNFLLECDAIFLIGYTGQFLGSDDMQLIMSTLPNEGINKAVLIGSKLDSAILQYPRKTTFEEAYQGTIYNCSEQAKDNINKCNDGLHNTKLLAQIKESLPPECVSSLAFTAGLKLRNSQQLNEAESLLVKSLSSQFPDFHADSETLLGLANIDDVKEKVFDATKASKNKIISERIESIIGSQKNKFYTILDEIHIQIKDNLYDLNNCDCEQLNNQIESIKESLDSVRIVVKNYFEKTGITAQSKIKDLALEIEEELENHADIEVKHSSETKHHSSTSGILFWKKTEHWDEIIHTNSSNVSDVYTNIKSYCLACKRMINDNFKTLLNIDELKTNIKTCILEAFKYNNNKEFDEKRILLPLENALSKICIQEISIDSSPYMEMIDQELGGKICGGLVKNENIPALKITQDKVMAQISRDIIQLIKDSGVTINDELNHNSSVFIDGIVEQLEENQKKLQILLEDKQSGIEKLNSFLDIINESKKILRGD